MIVGWSLVDEVDGVLSLFLFGNGGFVFDFGGLYCLNDKWEFFFVL